MILISAISVGAPVPPHCLPVSGYDDVVPILESLTDSAVLVYPGRREQRPPRIAREVFGNADIAKVTINGTPTQMALTVRSLALLQPDSYGLAQHVADVVAGTCRVRVALSSVTKLSYPRPSLFQHLRSLFPGASFSVDMNKGTVTSEPTIEWDTGDAADVCRASSESLGKLRVSCTGASQPIELAPSAVSPHGSRRWLEVASISSLPMIVNMALQTAHTADCRNCGRTVPTIGCPFCGTTLTTSRDQLVSPQL